MGNHLYWLPVPGGFNDASLESYHNFFFLTFTYLSASLSSPSASLSPPLSISLCFSPHIYLSSDLLNQPWSLRELPEMFVAHLCQVNAHRSPFTQANFTKRSLLFNQQVHSLGERSNSSHMSTEPVTNSNVTACLEWSLFH